MMSPGERETIAVRPHYQALGPKNMENRSPTANNARSVAASRGHLPPPANILGFFGGKKKDPVFSPAAHHLPTNILGFFGGKNIQNLFSMPPSERKSRHDKMVP